MMNLNSPLFDIVRIPVRRTPEVIAIDICSELGLDIEDVRSLDLPSRGAKTQTIRNARIRICRAMRSAGFLMPTVQAWFVGIAPATVRDYAYDKKAAEVVDV